MTIPDQLFHNPKRICVIYRIQNMDVITTLQEKVGPFLTPYKPIPPESIHLTSFHFGQVQSLYQEICIHNPSLTKAYFLHHVIQFFESIQQYCKENGKILDVHTTNLQIFHNKARSVLVIEVEKTKELQEQRVAIMQMLQEFLTTCGIGESFFTTSHTLRFQKDDVFRPHVTLATIGKHAIIPPCILVSSSLLTLTPYFLINFPG